MQKLKKLYPLRPTAKIHNDFFVFDLETGIERDTPIGKVIRWRLQATKDMFRFGVIYGHNFTKVIHTHEEMVNEFKDSRYKNKIVYAHNFGKFDGLVLFDNIFDLDDESIFIGSRFISCTNGNCIFADSLNIYKASVKEIGKKMGFDKLGMSDNYGRSIWPLDKARDINGCIRDCQIVWDALHEMFEEVGDIKVTIGSCSMSYFRRYALDFRIDANQNTKWFWQSYYGGRTEAFIKRKTHAKVIDVNSMYPWAQKTIDYPNPKYIKYEKIDNVKFFERSILSHYEGCARVLVDHPDFFIGLLPYRNNGKLCFPVGTFEGVYNFNELRFAMEHGVKILSISWAAYSEKMSSPFVKFVDRLYDGKNFAKSEGRFLDEWKYKHLLVNLYGKFAQRIEEKTIYIKDVISQYDIVEKHMKEKTFIKLIPFNMERTDAFLIVKEKNKREPQYSMPSFSSYITSAGRIKLAKKLIEMEKNSPVYCDTDSIFFEIDDGVKSSNFLGEWKIEDKIVTEIGGLKNYKYVVDNKEFSRIKGVPSKAKEIGDGLYEYYSLMGTKEGLRRNLEIGMPTKRLKKVSGKYDKRIVLKDGTTKPIII